MGTTGSTREDEPTVLTKESGGSEEEPLTRPDVAPPASPPTPQQTGAQLGRYVLLGLLGAGGMGEVYRAYDPKLRREVALKLLHSEARRRDRNATARIVREAQAMARVNHPNVISVFDVDDADDRVYIAMEYVEGTTLRGWMRAETRTWREVLRVFVLAGRGLAAAHDVGLVHRDFKPGNVLIGDDGRIRVTDFGLVRDEGDPSSSDADTASIDRAVGDPTLTEAGVVMGTPAYMAPEQAAGKHTDAASDQFSFCVALWEALYRKRPFPDDDLWRARVRGAPSPPSGDVPAWIHKIVARGLSPSPRQRWPSLVELLAALEDDPRRRRNRRLALLALPVALAGAVGLQRLAHGRALQRCEDEGAAVVDVWNELTRRELDAALTAALGSEGAATRDRVFPRLDEYANEWSDARALVCRAADVDRTWDATLAWSGRACLDARYDRLQALVEMLSAADHDAALRATASAATLPLIEPCTDRGQLALRVAEPADSDAREEIRAIRRELAAVYALRDLTRFDEGLQRVHELEARADALAWTPLRAEIGMLASQLHNDLGHYDEGFQFARSAFDLAFSAGHDPLAARAAIALAGQPKLGKENPGQAQIYLSLARLLIDRLGGGDETLHADLLVTEAVLAISRGDAETALASSKQALALREARFGPDHPMVARTLQTVGSAYNLAGDYDSARATYERAIALWEELVGPDHPETAHAINSLAIVYAENEDIAHAERLFRRVYEIRDKVLGPEHPDTARALENVGRALSALDKHDDALAEFRRAREIYGRALGTDHPDYGSALNAEGLTLLDMGRYDEAMKLFRQALLIQERAWGVDNFKLVSVINNIANLLAERGSYEQSVAEFERLLSLIERSLGRNHHQYAQVLGNLGLTYLDMGRIDEAERCLEQSLEIDEAQFGPDYPGLAGIHDNLGLVMVARGDDQRAFEQHAASLRLLEKADGPSSVRLVTPLTNMAITRIAAGRPEDALPLTRRALSLGRLDDGTYLPETIFTLRTYGDALLELGRPEEALPMLRQAYDRWTRDEAAPRELAPTALLLARALWDSGGDRIEARRLAQHALTTSTPDSVLTGSTYEDAAEWLRLHPVE